jgi:hypothetical protein
VIKKYPVEFLINCGGARASRAKELQPTRLPQQVLPLSMIRLDGRV